MLEGVACMMVALAVGLAPSAVLLVVAGWFQKCAVFGVVLLLHVALAVPSIVELLVSQTAHGCYFSLVLALCTAVADGDGLAVAVDMAVLHESLWAVKRRRAVVAIWIHWLLDCGGRRYY